jgi:transforming growth factor-beta-induced protein
MNFSPVRSRLALLVVFGLSVNAVLGQDPSFNDILGSGNFSSLVDLFIWDEINISDEFDTPVTFFAPNDVAFAKMDSGLLQVLTFPGFELHLRTFLFMHFLPVARNLDSFTNGETLTAVNEEAVTVSLATEPETLELSSPNTLAAMVLLPSVASSDGVFYELNDVLLPAFATIAIVTVISATEFSILFDLLVFSGVQELFYYGVTPTLFAPTNDAFLALGANVLDYYRSNKTATERLLMGHIVPDRAVPTPIVDFPLEIVSGAGETLSFVASLDANGYTFTINEANVVSPNILTGDGIVHVIDRVLQVAAAAVPAPSPVAPPAAVSSPAAPKRMMMMMQMMGNAKGMRMMNMGMLKQRVGFMRD